MYDYEGELDWFGENNFDLVKAYEEKRNYRNMNPTDLIKVSIDGKEAEVPLGDLVSSQALIGRATGEYGRLFYNFLFKSIGGVDLSSVSGDTIRFNDQQKQALDYFFNSHYDEKQDLEAQITAKSNELFELQTKLKGLQDKLNQLN